MVELGPVAGADEGVGDAGGEGFVTVEEDSDLERAALAFIHGGEGVHGDQGGGGARANTGAELAMIRAQEGVGSTHTLARPEVAVQLDRDAFGGFAKQRLGVFRAVRVDEQPREPRHDDSRSDRVPKLSRELSGAKIKRPMGAEESSVRFGPLPSAWHSLGRVLATDQDRRVITTAPHFHRFVAVQPLAQRITEMSIAVAAGSIFTHKKRDAAS